MNVKSSSILTMSEIAQVVTDLKQKRRYFNNRQNLTIFRLATCCGLRVSEIADLVLSDIDVESARPQIVVRCGKGGKRRVVPLHWDGRTLADLTSWLAERRKANAGPMDHLVVTNTGKRIDRSNLRKRFVRMTSILNRPLTIHDGRHTFVSLSLAGGRSLAEVRDAAGHSNVTITNVYLHAVADDGSIGNLFAV